MKFLYLKGIEVLGPTKASDLVKDSCFSEDLLVCPEDKAEDESAWKSAKEYPELKTALELNKSAVQENKPKSQPVEDVVVQPEIKEETQPEPVPPAAPVVEPAPEEKISQDKSQELPPLENTETETNPDLKKKPEIELDHEVVEEEMPKVNAPDVMVNDPHDHTFRIPQKEDDNLLEDLPSQSIFESREEEEKTPVVLGETNDSAEKKQKPEVIDHTSPAEEPLNTENLEEPVAKKYSFLEISNNKIISSSDGRVKKEKKNDLIFILSLVVIAVVAIALCFAFFNMNKNKNAKAPEQEQENEIESPVVVEQEKFENNPFEQDEMQPNTQEQQNSVEEQTIDIVKNTMLPSKGKTIGEYLKNAYGEDYQTSWSAKPFTDKIYIVEFFASQVRNEPFVYLFRVDTEQQKITGALNNITLDLIG